MNKHTTEEKSLCLTLDLENDWYFDEPGYDHLTFEYLDAFIDLIDGLDIPLSVFVVGQTLEQYPAEIDHLSDRLNCDFHLHSYQHDTSKNYDFRDEVTKGKKAFRDHFGRDPTGYRAPQGNITQHELSILEELGFEFDSSIFPSYRPGVYNNLSAPLTPYTPSGAASLLEIPPGAFSGIRIPTSHSYFKLIGRSLSSYLAVSPLPEIVVYSIHLQDLFKTASHDNLPVPKRWIMKRNLNNAERMLQKNISTLLSRGYQPRTMTDIYEAHAIDDDYGSRTDTSEDHLDPSPVWVSAENDD